MYLICHVTSHDHDFERLCKFTGKSSLRYEITLIIDKSCDYRRCVSEDMIFLICHLAPSHHTLKGLCEFTGGTPHDKTPLRHVW